MVRKRPSAKLRQQVMQRARGLCEYCYSQQRYCPDRFVCDHIFPVSFGGETTIANLAFACIGCNSKKGNERQALDSLTGEWVPLYHPRKHIWSDHFRWSDDFLRLIGVSPVGRATIHKLDLNRANVVNLRRLLITFKEHPPAPIVE